MTIRTLNTPEEVESIFKHPEIAGEMGHGPDWSGRLVLERGVRVWAFDGEDGAIGGAFMIVPKGDGVATVHVAVLPESRGEAAVLAAREVVACETAAGMTLRGATPKSRPEAFAFAFAAGLHYVGESEHEWFTEVSPHGT